MELKLIVSGVTTGESIWGCSDDSAFLGTLYVPSSVDTKFDIRLNKMGNKIYAYYHYLVYNTINENGGRTGSYFGLTVRMDSYCTDYKTIYSVLDIIYRKKIIGNLLQHVNGGRLQYTCPKLSDKDEYLTSLEKEIRETLGTTLSLTDFKNIPALPSKNNIVRINRDEASAQDVMKAVGQFGACSISSEYENKSVESRVKAAYQEGIRSRQNEVNSLQSKIDDLAVENGKISQQLRSAKEQKVHDNDFTKKNNSNSRGQTWIRPGNEDGDEDTRSNKIITYFMIGLLAAFLLVLFYILFFGVGQDNSLEKSQEYKGTPHDSISKKDSSVMNLDMNTIPENANTLRNANNPQK